MTMPSALLTGVGRRRGIAAGIAAGLATDGWDLALSYWHPYDERLAVGGEAEADDPDRIADELRGLGRQVVLVPGDLEDPSVPSAVVETAVNQVDSFDRHYAVNVRATWLLIAAFARQLSVDGGSVVALTSDHTVGNLPYGVTKGGWTGWCSRRRTSSPASVSAPT